MREDLLERGEDLSKYPIFAENAQPDLWNDVQWVWEGYSSLARSRQWGMSGPQPISLGDMLAYMELRSIADEDEREEFVHLVQHLDMRFLADYMAKHRPKSAGPMGGQRKK